MTGSALILGLGIVFGLTFQLIMSSRLDKAANGRNKREIREPWISNQWVIAVRNYSSQYQDEDWSAKQVIGAPSLADGTYGDYETSWSSLSPGLSEFLVLEFQYMTFVTHVNIYENWNAGGVKSIQGYSSLHQQWQTLWETDQVDCIEEWRIFSPTIREMDTDYKFIKIETDASVCESWFEIDAVELVGIGGCGKGYYYNTVSESCEQCGLGTYNSIGRILFCDQCPDGMTTLTLGATSVDECVQISEDSVLAEISITLDSLRETVERLEADIENIKTAQ